MVKPHDAFTTESCVRLWTHECMRVFGDRLIDNPDREWFLGHCKDSCIKFFGKKFEAVFGHLQYNDVTDDRLERLAAGDDAAPPPEKKEDPRDLTLNDMRAWYGVII